MRMQRCHTHQPLPKGSMPCLYSYTRTSASTLGRSKPTHYPGFNHLPATLFLLRPTPHIAQCSKDANNTNTNNSKNSNNNNSSPPERNRQSWWKAILSSLKPQTLLRVMFNLSALWLLTRIWPLGGRADLQETDNAVVQVPFSDFINRVKADDVSTVAVDGLQINFHLRNGTDMLPYRPTGTESVRVSFSTRRPVDYGLPYDVMEKNRVEFTAVDRKENAYMNVLVYAVYGAIFLSLINKLPLKGPPKTTARKHMRNEDKNTRITFADVAGVDEAKEELQEIVEYLRAPERFSKLGARPPSGILLVGAPGTGKTLLAKAVAGEADAPFFSISASEFVELYVGMGAMRVRELFANARKEAPAIVFIDEIDAVAKGRDTRLRSVGNDEREQTLNQLLTELDGFDSDKDNVVICIAATNRPDVLDSALLRPGRFDRRVTVERPDKIGRTQILKVHIEKRNLPLADDVSIETIASTTTGFSGADLANLVNEAALLAGRFHKSAVGREEFDAAIMRSVAGIEKKRSILQGIEKEVVSKHEVGHALVGSAVARLIPLAAEVEKLSIIPRSGGALGFTYIPPKTEDRALMFDSEIRGQLTLLMGGRAAEHLTCHAISTGAMDDIRRATSLAVQAVSEFGLSTAVGPMSVQALHSGGSDEMFGMLKDSNTSRVVEKEVRDLLNAAFFVACDVLTTNSGLHTGLSELLIQRERLEGEDLVKWLTNVKVPDSLRKFVLSGELPDLSKYPDPIVSSPRTSLDDKNLLN